MTITNNPFGQPTVSKNNSKRIKSFLAIMTREMGLYNAYNSDNVVKAYNYCKNELGADFDEYIKAVRRHIKLQEADYKEGKVSIHYLTDVFTKFPKIITQLKKEGKWVAEFPYGWRIDSTGAPYSSDYQLISRGLNSYIYANKNNKSEVISVVYNSKQKKFYKIINFHTKEVIWENKK